MPLNFSIYNVTSPSPVVEVHSEFNLILLTIIAFAQFMQIAITLYYFQKLRSDE